MSRLGELLALALLAATTLLVPATVGAFTVRARKRPPHRARAVRRTHAGGWLTLGVLAVGGAAAAVGVMLGAQTAPTAAVAALLAASVAAWGRLARTWAVRGVVAWALTLDTSVLYLLYVLHWTVTAGLTAVGLVASSLLLAVEAFVFVLAVGYVWELVDVLTRREWPRAVDPRALPQEVRRTRPFVSLHVPAHNEPPDMVIATLERLLALDYDDYEILLVDNNTTDPALWRPVEEFCSRHERVRFIHLEDWPGYKSGALNFALTRTDPRAEVIGIVDADYLVEPDFLAACAPLFADPDVAFVQTPQDYRDWEHYPYFRRLYHSYGYFFDVSQRSRNERNGAIFGGTMGLIRRTALADVGGWDEWCITEDAELSLRLLRSGWTGLHVAESFGHGIMPLTFEALKRQRFRWCFGGVQILRMHWRSLMPWDRRPGNRLSLQQRWAYLVGGLQWFGDLTGLVFTGFLLLGALDVLLGHGLLVRRLSGFLLVSVVVLVLLGSVRSVALVRRTSGASWREAFGAFGLWQALGWAVALGAARGLVAREGAFLRTPKVRGEMGWRDAVRGNVAETLLGVLTLSVAVPALAQGRPGALLLGVLLAVQAVGHLAAPVNSLAAIRTELPDDLRRRRREKLPSWTRLAGPARRALLVPLVGAATAGMLFVALAAPAGGPGPSDVRAQAVAPDITGRDQVRTHDGRRRASAQRAARPQAPASVAVPAVLPAPSATQQPGAAATSTRSAAPSPVATTAASRPTRAASPSQAATPTAPTTTAAPASRPTALPTTASTTRPTQATTPTRRP